MTFTTSLTGTDRFVALPPTRLADSRTALNLTNRLQPNETRQVRLGTLTGIAPIVPSDATSVLIRITAVDATEPTNLVVTQNGALSSGSNVNVVPGVIGQNHTLVDLTNSGTISIYNLAGTVDIIVDIEGNTYDPLIA